MLFCLHSQALFKDNYDMLVYFINFIVAEMISVRQPVRINCWVRPYLGDFTKNYITFFIAALYGDNATKPTYIQ